MPAVICLVHPGAVGPGLLLLEDRQLERLVDMPSRDDGCVALERGDDRRYRPRAW